MRKFFEVDRFYIVFASIQSLVEDKKVEHEMLSKVMKKYKIDPEKPNPAKT